MITRREHLGTRESCGDLLGHGEVHVVEHSLAVVGGKLVTDAAQSRDDLLH